MKKYTRQRLILNLIEENEIQTQEELSEYLKERGVRATQATISRDIKELRISKVQTTDGEYKYAIIDTVHDSLNERLDKIFKSAVLSIKRNEDIDLILAVPRRWPETLMTSSVRPMIQNQPSASRLAESSVRYRPGYLLQ